MSVDLKRAVRFTDLARLMLKDGEKIPEHKPAQKSVLDSFIDLDLRYEAFRRIQHSLDQGHLDTWMNSVAGFGSPASDNGFETWEDQEYQMWTGEPPGTLGDIYRRAIRNSSVRDVEIDERTGHVRVRIMRVWRDDFSVPGGPTDGLARVLRDELLPYMPVGVGLEVVYDTPCYHLYEALHAWWRSECRLQRATTEETLDSVRYFIQRHLERKYGHYPEVIASVRVSWLPATYGPHLTTTYIVDGINYTWNLVL